MDLEDVQEHLPSFPALEKAHQNILSGKVQGHEMRPLLAKPDMAFQIRETMDCRGALKKYAQTRGADAKFEYAYCLGSKVCPAETDAWIHCFRRKVNSGGDIRDCAQKKRAAELCAIAWAQDFTRVIMDHDLYRK